jgi:D-amino-acid dehydrogenase
VKIAIIGGGLIGSSCAAYLQREGALVTVFDHGDPTRRASYGNAGSISDGSIIPFAGPGMVKMFLRSLVLRDSALQVDLAYALTVLPWLYAMWRQGSPTRRSAAVIALARLLAPCFQQYQDLLGTVEFAKQFVRSGQLYVYNDDKEYEKDAGARRYRMQHGILSEHLTSPDISALEPCLRGDFAHATYFPSAGHVVNANALLDCIMQTFIAAGGAVKYSPVRRLTLDSAGRPQLQSDDLNTVRFDKVIIAAGVRSASLARMIGVCIPVESLRGYAADFNLSLLRRPVLVAGKKLFLSPTDFGTRATGVVEIAGISRGPRIGPAALIARQALTVLPDLAGNPDREWMGHRPSTPDSVPIISTLAGCRHVLVATGHGATGLMSAAVTGRLICDLSLGRPPIIDPLPYRADRF